MVYVDPRDDIVIDAKLQNIPADSPIHIISSRTLNDACFYMHSITRVIVWHDKYSDPDIDKAIDLDPHAIDTVCAFALNVISIDEFLTYDTCTYYGCGQARLPRRIIKYVKKASTTSRPLAADTPCPPL